MEQNTPQEEIKKISRHEFYFETSLYKFIENVNFSENILDGDVDAYNFESGFETTYNIYAMEIGGSSFNNFYKITLTCKRNGRDKLRFFIYQDDESTVKLGQWPSLADIQFAEIGKKYDRFLSRDDMKEFKKAIGLAAHGIGSGSFVYLRRIFENLIKETFKENQKHLGIKEEDFLRKRMEEKVSDLKDRLPSQLVEMKSIYSVLSKGVHELSEQECLKYFPVLKLSIELILEQKIEMEIKKERDKAVKKQIADISKDLK